MFALGVCAVAIKCRLVLIPCFVVSQTLGADFTICNCDGKYIDELMPQNKAYTRKVSVTADLTCGLNSVACVCVCRLIVEWCAVEVLQEVTLVCVHVCAVGCSKEEITASTKADRKHK